jgi:hypothetical protein
MPVSMSAVFTGRAARSIVRLLTISRDLKGAIPAVSAWLEVGRFMLLALWSIHPHSLLFHKYVGDRWISFRLLICWLGIACSIEIQFFYGVFKIPIPM